MYDNNYEQYNEHGHFEPGGLKNHWGPPTPPTAPPADNPPPPPRSSSPVPPPIPPVRYVPGMNVQEQMCNLSERINIAINRWNEIQHNCYEALDQVVGAAVNNDVYYSPDEVRYTTGYDEDMSCSYSLVEARAVDRSGKPIYCNLRAAYNNETNSGAQEQMPSVSFVTSAQMVITAVNATATRWDGSSFFNGNPGNSQPNAEIWVAGWNRNGILRFFPGDCGEAVLRQNKMISCIGPVFPVIKSGQIFSEVVESMGSAPGSIQAMGWKKFIGNKVFFSCSNYDQPGMTPLAVAKLLQRMGCETAVITSYQVNAATAWDATPIAGTENTVPAGGGEQNEVITAPGLTGGMTYLGQLTTAPLQWNIPANCANWVISKRPPRGWNNAFTTEIANVVQRLGNQENTMSSIAGQIKGENTEISKLQYQVTQNTNDIADLKTTVGGFDGRITGLETQLNNVETQVNKNTAAIVTINQEIEQLKAKDQAQDAALAAETAAREAQDNILKNAIDTEASERAAEDAKLKAEIDTEATTRANADRNLQAAIEAEQSARSTKDTEHEARMDALQAQEQKDYAALSQAVENLKDGTDLPIASATQLGAIKIGKNLYIAEDGTLSATGGGGGADFAVLAGTGISVTREPTGDYTVTVDDTVVATVSSVQDVKTTMDNLVEKVDNLETTVEDIETRVTGLETKSADTSTAIEGLTTDVTDVKDAVTDLTGKVNQQETEVGDLKTSVDAITTDIEGIKSGAELPIASTTTLGAIKVGANLSISEDGTLSATGGEGQGGETVAGGTGVTVVHDSETNVATVSIADDVMEKINAEDGAKDLAETAAETASKAEQDAAAAQTTADEAKEGLDGKVNRSGDKMTGALSVEEVLETGSPKTTTVDGLTGVKFTDVVGESYIQKDGIRLNTVGAKQINFFNSEEKTTYAVVRGSDPTDKNDLTTKNYVDLMDAQALTKATTAETTANAAMSAVNGMDAKIKEKVSKDGDTMTGNLWVGEGATSVGITSLSSAAIIISNTDSSTNGVLGLDANDMSGNISLSKGNGGGIKNVRVNGVANPTENNDAANKQYVDSQIETVNADIADINAAQESQDQKIEQQNTRITKVENDLQSVDDTATSAHSMAADAEKAASAAEEKAAAAQTSAENKVNRSGDTMTGNLSVPQLQVSSLGRRGIISFNSFASYDDNLYLLCKDGSRVLTGMSTEYSTLVPIGVGEPKLSTDAATKNYADGKVAKTGDTMSGKLTVGTENNGVTLSTNTGSPIVITNSTTSTNGILGINRNDSANNIYISKGNGGVGGNVIISGVNNPVNSNDAANKGYVDSAVASAGGNSVQLRNIILNGNQTVELWSGNYLYGLIWLTGAGPTAMISAMPMIFNWNIPITAGTITGVAPGSSSLVMFSRNITIFYNGSNCNITNLDAVQIGINVMIVA